MTPKSFWKVGNEFKNSDTSVSDQSSNIAPDAWFLWRVERVIILFCYFNCNSIIYIFVFTSFVTFIILILSLSFYHSNIRVYSVQ